MSMQLEKVSTTDLKIGLYVERLDRPWTETPFLFQGFFIRDEDDIETLQHHCQHVFVDAQRSWHDAVRDAAQVREDTWIRRPSPGIAAASATATAGPAPAPAKPRYTYAKELPVEAEMPMAEKIHVEAGKVAQTLLERLNREGKLDIELAKSLMVPMMESVLRNPDALIWLSRMKHHDSYVYHHSVDCSILGMAFARHLGLSKESIAEIGLGCMLFDVGKTHLPGPLLNKAGPLSSEEWRIARGHVQESIAILEHTGGVTQRILDLVRSHHERYDGSGYPDGLMANQIPTFAKIAGMVDCYDAMVSPRPYAKQLDPYEAIREIYRWRGNLFQPEVVERFMQVMGVFPTGSLVQLNTGSVGVVVAQNEVRRLRPKLMLIMNERKQLLSQFVTVDLMDQEPYWHADQYWIERHLPAGTYGIDPKDLYL